eukprot:CAMPEP_0113318430 /NCGR_PEP_ID=MMETSP0010_2-20120614/13000_1 /TAXON_ID=216773 ORGANISM="Corethron hystrix, Strain 308" /NCGR_SAMPLE_ID=MMETSP0010_2 /ASSEMBLY_ACC=CAM_ASM_000155 /LENGTH=501 /DNA_ID=CAMNT_0000175727 /DNA_START=99 /DNA_END=1602 /DNA_ORIENTATION=- /assembly_acc=CAM_ASM_000155
MFSIFFLLFLAAFCDQVNSQCLDTDGVNEAVDEWLDDKSTAESKYGPIGDWEFCNDISFYILFYVNSNYGGNDKAREFNDDIYDWDTSAVTSMYGMFYQASAFNQDISGWDTARVTSMKGMFDNASAFNQDISGWDTAKVTSMGGMFSSASAFNQDISGWDTAAVAIMEYMFLQAYAFNQDISGYDTSAVTTMTSMFDNASAFNQDISGWDTARVTSMNDMFNTANAFNQDISGYDTAKVTSMAGMFDEASAFNQDISDWDTARVKYMNYMFYQANSFRVCLVWDLSMVEHTTEMFDGSNGRAGCAVESVEPTQPPKFINTIPWESFVVPMIVGTVLLCFAVVFAFHFSRKHAATSSAAQSISSSQGDHDNVDNNDDNGLRSRDRSQLSSDIVITPGKKPKPSEILDPPISNVGESQVFEAEVMATTTDLNVTEIRALLGRFKPEGYRPLRLLLVAPSRTISEEMLVSRIISSYEGDVEDGIGERTLAENLVKDYYILGIN